MLTVLGCKESSTSVEADLTNYETMITQPGFQWIPFRKEQYIPEKTVIDSLKKYYNTDYSFYIFAKPSCTCEGPHNDLAYFFTIMDSVGIDYSNSEIFAMNSINNIQPYDDIIEINDLPSFFVLKNNEVFYSIRDTLVYREEHSIDDTLEEILLEALKGSK